MKVKLRENPNGTLWGVFCTTNFKILNLNLAIELQLHTYSKMAIFDKLRSLTSYVLFFALPDSNSVTIHLIKIIISKKSLNLIERKVMKLEKVIKTVGSILLY